VQYRVQLALWMLTAVIRPAVLLAAWSAVAARRGGAVAGMSTHDLAGYYIVVALLTELTASWDAWYFEGEVRYGGLSAKLLRPLHPLHYAIAENVTAKALRVSLLCPVLAVLAWSYDARLVVRPPLVVVFVVAVLLASVLRFLLGWLVAAFAFWTTRVIALAYLFESVSFLLGGQAAPLLFLPGWLRGLSYVLPFGYTLGIPALVLTGPGNGSRLLPLVGGQLVWVGLAGLAFHRLWKAGLARYSAVGG